MNTLRRNKSVKSESIERLYNSAAHDPHTVLGLHALDDQRKVIRVLRPGAREIHLEVKGEIVKPKRVDEAGLFEYIVPKDTGPLDYRVWHESGLLAFDPYVFWPTLSPTDQYLFANGVHYNIHRQMGARLAVHEGCQGVQFSVWAPSARGVSLIADFNHWDGRRNPMRALGTSGIWELFVPGIGVGEKYKFEVRTQTAEIKVKADPYALSSELRPKTASVVEDIESFAWTDEKWLHERSSQNLDRPMLIYELHLGSWKKKNSHFLNYQELAHEIAAYCIEMGYTHVELLPVTEHPFDESWGYQVTGFFAATSRYGKPKDFQYFVNYLHEHNIGVIIDWVPGHFPTDAFGLARFDGTALYEHEDPRQGFHPHWNTCIFNFGRKEVSNFLIASALFWLDVMHVDGLRVDAVASMLYLDYGRDNGDWIPNQYGGKENLDAIEFIKHANSVIHQRFPGVLTIAEESTSFAGVSHPLHENGLGFDLKWNMGWMNDTLRYIEKDPIFRGYHHNDLTFGLLYAFTERFVLVLSHDEVVHGKRSLLSKMPGDLWQKFANLRLLLSYQICQPGKKLIFMGAEIGQWNEWYCKSEVEWMLLHFPYHSGLQRCVKELNQFYVREKALWECDFSYHGFEWVDFHDHVNSVISYYRKGNTQEEALLCVHNFTPTYHEEYILPAQGVRQIEEIFNSDDEQYGGSGKIRTLPHIDYNAKGASKRIRISLAPLATQIFRVKFL